MDDFLDDLVKKCYLCGRYHDDILSCVLVKDEKEVTEKITPAPVISPPKVVENEYNKNYDNCSFLDDVITDSDVMKEYYKVRGTANLVKIRGGNSLELIDANGKVDHKASLSINSKYIGCQISASLARNICDSIRNYYNDVDSLKLNSVQYSDLAEREARRLKDRLENMNRIRENNILRSTGTWLDSLRGSKT